MTVQVSAGNYAYPLVLTVTPISTVPTLLRHLIQLIFLQFEHKPLNITVDHNSIEPTGACNITIPQLPWEAGHQILVSLSDQTGFASGGTSDTQGTITLPNLDFFFNLDSLLNQCQKYPITRFTRATQPVKIIFGDSFAIQAPVFSVFTYTWLANVKSGTPIVFTMVDALGKQGGSSNARVVENSNNSTCLAGGHSGLSNGAIAGIVITLVTLTFGIVSAFLFLRNRGQRFTYHSLNLDSDLPSSSHGLPAEYQTTPFILPFKPESPPVTTSKRYSNSTSSHSPLPSPNPGPTTPNHLIVHRDITEEEEGEGQVIESPPSYSARRAPIPGITQPPQPSPEEAASPLSLPLPEKLGG